MDSYTAWQNWPQAHEMPVGRDSKLGMWLVETGLLQGQAAPSTAPRLLAFEPGY